MPRKLLSMLRNTGGRMGEPMATRALNGNQGLRAAMALLIHNQSQFVQTQALFVAQLHEIANENQQRFRRIESELEQIKVLVLQHSEILKRHEQILKDLPEAIRQKIGF